MARGYGGIVVETVSESGDKSGVELSIGLMADTLRFVWRLMRSQKVPLKVKILLGGLAAYLVSPVDIIPDSIPVLGHLDDVFVSSAALGLAVKWLPKELIVELWESDVSFDDALAAIRRSISKFKK